MAQRRVNTSFLLIATLVLVGLAGAVVLGQRILFREKPDRYIKEADRLMRSGSFLEAKADYDRAIMLDPKNLDLYVKLADCLRELTRLDPDTYYGQDLGVLNKALAIDPKFLPALEKLMVLQVEAIEFRRRARPELFTGLHDVAARILDVKPDNLKAEAYLHVATIAGWLQGMATPDDVLRSDMEALAALQTKDPTNPDVPYYLAQAYVQQRKEAIIRRDAEKSQALRDKLVEVFERAIEGQKDNPVMYLRYYQVLRRANMQFVDTDDDPVDYIGKMKSVLERARAMIKPDDSSYSDVYIQSAEFLFRRNTPETIAEAEKLLRELCTAKPDDQAARLALAKLIHTDRRKRGEAIDLLRKEITDRGGPGAAAMPSTRVELEAQTHLALATYLIEEYSDAVEQARGPIRAEIDANFEKLESKAPMWSETLKLKAKIALLEGGAVGAIRAIPIIEQGIEAVKVASQGRTVDWELEYMLAKCYFDSKQTGEARNRLLKITEQFPSFIPARVLLAELLVEDKEFSAAQDQLRELAKHSPNNPAITRIRVAIWTAMNNANPNLVQEHRDEIGKAIDAMPESDYNQKIQKIKVCLYSKMPERAIPILENLRSENPVNAEVVAMLCQLYTARGERDRAQSIIAEAAAKDPESPSLKLIKAGMEKRTPEEMMELERQVIMALKDPFVRNMKLFELYNNNGKHEEALKFLDEAEGLKPNDTKMLDVRFQLAVADRKWEQAAEYIKRLGDADEAGGRIYRYRLALAKGDAAGATEVARDLVKNYGQFARSYLCLAEVQRLQHQYLDAITNYAQAMQKQTDNVDALRGLIDCSYALDKPDDAKRYIELALKRQPNNAYFQEQEVAWQLNYGDPIKAIEPREMAVKANPDSLGARLALAAAYFQVAQSLQGKAKPAEAYSPYVAKAKAQLQSIKAKWPDDRLAYAYLADIGTFESNPAEGEAALRELASRPAHQDKPDVYVLLAEYLVRAGKLDAAEEQYKVALEKSKNATEIQQKLAAFYANTGRPDKALAVLDANSPDRRVQQQIIEIYISANRLGDAETALKRQLAVNPRDAQFLAMLGFIQMNTRKPQEAMASLNAALELDPKNQSALYYRGLLHLRATPANTDAALNDLLAARDLNPRNVQVRLALAEAHNLRKEMDDAMREMEAILNFAPTNKDVRMKLIELYGTQMPPRWSDVERLIADGRKAKGGDTDPDWLRVEASMWMTRREPDKAIDRIKQAISMVRNQPDRVGPLLQDYLNYLLLAQRYQQLAAECDSMLQDKTLAAKSWWGYQLRGVARCNLDRKPEAMNDYDAALGIAIKIKNDDAMAAIIQSISDTIGLEEAIKRVEREFDKGDMHWGVIGVGLLLQKGDATRAVTMVERVMANKDKMTPRERETALSVAGTAYMMAGPDYYAKAVDVYTQLLNVNGDDLISLNNLACLWVDYIKPPVPATALDYSRKAIEIMTSKGGTDANILDTHGWVLLLNGKVDDGMTYLRAALERKPQMMEARYHLGSAYLVKNMGVEAQREFDAARQIIDDRKARKQPVDAEFIKRVDEGTVKAKQMLAGGAS